MKARRGDMVIVRWLDAYGHCETWTPDADVLAGGKFEVESVGYYLGIKKGYLTLCGDWGPGQKARIFAIPYGMILEVELAKKKGKKTKGGSCK
jgi:hypothetical protein